MIVNLLFQKQENEKRYSWQSGSLINGNKLFNEADIIRDLKLDILLDALADDDKSLRILFKNILLHPLTNPDEIHMRQGILKDAMLSPEIFYEIYRISSDSIYQTAIYNDLNKPMYAGLITAMKKVITYSEVADIYLKHLSHVHNLISNSMENFTSVRLKEFCQVFLSDYSQNFLEEARKTLDQLLLLRTESEIVVGGHLGTGLKLTDIRLHHISKDGYSDNVNKPFGSFATNNARRIWNRKSDAVILLDNNRLAGHGTEIVEASFIWILRILNNFTDNCKKLFEGLHEMFGFYSGCINLHQKVLNTGTNITFPIFLQDGNKYEFHNLNDLGLVLKEGKSTVGNTLSIVEKRLCIITGSNQGGKSTFLRSIGLAQLMAQSGLFVAAEAMQCNIYKGIYTLFPNEEDSEIRYGLLEEELHKLSDLVSHMQPGSLLLMNESFSTTVEYDASLLAEQIIGAFIKCGITTLFVTHLYEYAHKLFQQNPTDCCFLRAGRISDGSRTYKIEEGEPLKSSFSMDLYRQILGKVIQ